MRTFTFGPVTVQWHSRASGIDKDENDTRGRLVSVQVGRLVVETWVTARRG